jgi:hypothetical protein
MTAKKGFFLCTAVFMGLALHAMTVCNEVLSLSGSSYQLVLSHLNARISSELQRSRLRTVELNPPAQRSSPSPRFKRYLGSIDQLRQIFTHIASARDGVEPQFDTVVYPAAGFDSAFPVRFFPNSRLLIAIDNQPFIGRYQFTANSALGLRLGLRPVPAWGEAWVPESMVMDEKAVASQVLANLRDALPEVHILRIIAFKSRLAPLHVHGLILFNQGPGTSVRSYLHVHSPQWSNAEMQPWWIELLPEGSPIAVILKGSQQFYATADGSALLHAKTMGFNGAIFNFDGRIEDSDRNLTPGVRKRFSIPAPFGYAYRLDFFSVVHGSAPQ